MNERKGAKEVLRENESRYKMIFEESPIAIALTRGPDIFYANPALVSMFGFSDPDVVLELRALDLFTPECRPRIRENIKRRTEGLPVPSTYEAECLKKNGSTFPVLINAAKAMFPEGPVIIAFLLDITKQKENERRIRASEEKYRILFESANDAIFLMEDDRFIDCNAKALVMFGASREQIIGQTPYRFSPQKQPDGRESQQSALEKINAVLQGKPQFFEWEHCRLDGTLFDAEISLTDLDIEGSRYLLAIVRDVSQRKIAEEEKKSVQKQLHQAQRMEAIGTLAGGIAHDFNNILTSIIGFSELVQDDLSEKDQVVRENIDLVIKAGLRAKELVRHILTFSRSSESVKGPIVPSLQLKEAVKLLKASLPAAIETRVHIINDESMVFGDATQVHQVIMNLCLNAAHAMKAEGGLLEIRLEKTTLEEKDVPGYRDLALGDYVKLTVSDTGHGISKRVIDRIFEPFFTTKSRGEGTGLGLSVVHGIIKDMQGDIQVDSEPGKGTSFHVLIPVYEGATESAPYTASPSPRKGKGRILFVDDEQPITVMADRMLHKLGYDVTVLTESLEALKVFASRTDAFDLVITDFNMPKMNGIEFSRRILEMRPGLPVILCTGFSDSIDQQILDGIGISRIMMKPVIYAELAATVKSALGQKE